MNLLQMLTLKSQPACYTEHSHKTMSVKCIDRLWQNVQVKCSCGWKRGLVDMGTATRERSRWINRKEERESFSSWLLDHGLSILFILHRKSTKLANTCQNDKLQSDCLTHMQLHPPGCCNERIWGETNHWIWQLFPGLKHQVLKDIKRLLYEAHSSTWTQYPRAKLYNRFSVLSSEFVKYSVLITFGRTG